MFSCEFCEISKNTFFTEHVWATAFLFKNYQTIIGNENSQDSLLTNSFIELLILQLFHVTIVNNTIQWLYLTKRFCVEFIRHYSRFLV